MSHINIRRVISAYNSHNDSLNSVHDISHIPIDKLKAILVAKAEDKSLLDRYTVDEVQYFSLVKLMSKLKKPHLDLTYVEVFYECFIEPFTTGTQHR